MKKTLLSLVAFALALTSAQAGVTINSTNFPDENFRTQVAEQFDTDGDGIISDEEMTAGGGQNQFHRVSNLKGLELLTSIYRVCIYNYADAPGLTNFDYELPNLTELELNDMDGAGILTTVDASKCVNLEYFQASGTVKLSTLKLPVSLKHLFLYNASLVKTFAPAAFPHLESISLTNHTGITDVDFTGHHQRQRRRDRLPPGSRRENLHRNHRGGHWHRNNSALPPLGSELSSITDRLSGACG